MTVKKLAITPVELKTILTSHGWFDLAPFEMPNDRSSISRAFTVQQGDGHFCVFVKDGKCLVDILSGEDSVVMPVVRKCLSLDINVSELYSTLADNAKYDWIAEKKFGRYLRSPTLFEDCFKIMATANINWNSTKSMIKKTVDNFGSTVNGVKAFPLPDQLVQVSENDLKSATRCGYRADSFLDLCRNALDNSDLYLGDAWKHMTAEEFKSELIKVKGLGEICVSYLGRFYGKPLDYTIDSWVVKRCDELWNLNFRKTNKKGRSSPDLKRYGDWANSYYKRFSPYGPSIFWFEITRYWHQKEDYSAKWWG